MPLKWHWLPGFVLLAALYIRLQYAITLFFFYYQGTIKILFQKFQADVDSGEIIEQAAVSVKLDDSEASLLERIHVEEHRIYPIAMERVAQKMRTMSK